MSQIAELLNKLDLSNKDIAVFTEALTHRSYINEIKDTNLSHNERLEFLGDAVLELAVTKFLFKTYPDQNEGTLTSFRAALVKTESLALEAKKLDLGLYILMSKGEEATGGRQRPYILANTMEAIIGAIYLTNGFEAAESFILDKICYKIDAIVSERSDLDAKSRLQELAQERVKITPVYKLLSASGPDHNKVFTMGIYIGDNLFGSGEGKSKQEAEQVAAQEAINSWEDLQSKYYKN
ncbi:MAG: ribonuclease III [Ignavibacteriaceae bacterium]|nr:ribonuclease III [Ignavibacteriaceae bacterium]